MYIWELPWWLSGKESACQCRRHKSTGLILILGRWAGEGNGSPLQYSCLEKPMDRGDWRATLHGVTRVGHNLVTKQQQYQQNIICVCVHTSGWIDSCSIITWYSDNSDNVLGWYNDNVKFAQFFLLHHMETWTSFLANQWLILEKEAATWQLKLHEL